MKTKKSLKETTLKSLFTLLILSPLMACNQFNTDTATNTGTAANTDTAANSEQTITTNYSNDISDPNFYTPYSLSWTAPVTREDQSAISITEIAAYRVYIGTKTRNYQQQVTINDAYADDLPLANVIQQAGTYYLAITTVDSRGVESAFSQEVVITV